MSVSAERKAIIALLTAFALLVQALIPSLASAAPMTGADMVICTERGLEPVPDDPGSGQSAAGHACQSCVCAVMAVMPHPVLSVLTVAYVVANAPVAATPQGVRPPLRAPPRPPGQGPPLPNV